MEHSVKVRELPASLTVPDDEQRLSVDRTRRCLTYRGFMSKADYDRLARLSNDLHYRRALDELFRISTEPDTQSLWLGRLLHVFRR